jgi:regulator of sirC expression with transglutaminase-like and TPR domain
LTEIIALLDLLDDENPDVVEAVRGRLEKLGESALDALMEASQGDDAKRRVRARAAVRSILARKATLVLSNYLGDEEIDLETAVLMLAETENPLLNREEIKSRLEELAKRVKARLADASGPLARSQSLTAVLAHEEGFSGNTQDYYDPSNSYIDFVLDRKVGIPISLAVLYVLVGRRAGLDVYGVSFPRHFVAGYAEPGWVTHIDAYHNGKNLDRAACEAMLAAQNLPMNDQWFARAGVHDTIRRMLGNLAHVYRQRDDQPRLTRVETLLKVIEVRKRHP